MLGREELLRRQQVLGQFGEFILDHEDLPAILQEGCRLIAEALGADLAKIIEIDAKDNSGLVRAGVGWKPGVVGEMRINLSGKTSEAFALQSAQPVVTQDVKREDRFDFPDFLLDHGVVALVNVPILLPGREAYGLLQVDAREPREFDAEDISFLRTYAMTLGPVIDRLNTVKELERSNERLRLAMERNSVFRLFDHAPGFIAMVRGPEHQFVFANQSYLTLVGRQDIIGQPVRQALPEVAEQGFTKILDQVFETGERFVASRMPIELERGNSAGCEVRYVSFVYAPLRDECGTIFGIFAEGHDVTDEVRAQEQVHLLQSEIIHLSRVSAMGTMAATLGHELNQPLTAIKNYASAAERLLRGGGDQSQILEAIAAASRNATRTGDIIRSLRNMANRGEIKKEPFHPHDVIREVGALAAMGDCAKIETNYTLSADDVVVIGDSIQVQQVLLNLLRNACEAVSVKDNGQVSIMAERFEDAILISVADNGEGIPISDMPKLFEAFFSTKSEGMGMGLSISRTIVEAHGGRIWAENRPEGGTRFCFTLPAASIGAAHVEVKAPHGERS